MLFQTEQIGRFRLKSLTVSLNDGSLRPFKRKAARDLFQITEDRRDVRPGEVCWIVDVAIRASDDFELGDDAKKRPRLYVGEFVLKL